MIISGHSIIAGEPSTSAGETFRAFDPSQNIEIEPVFHSATPADVARAAELARDAFALTKSLPGGAKGRFLRAIAAGLEGTSSEIVEHGTQETALPPARVEGELVRTTSQLRLFAALVEEGSWVDARLETGDPERKPLPKPDLRSMLRPIGPVVVFGASNFPLAFSVAGGDTVSAFAAGCPVIVKAHPAHPATSAIVGQIVVEAARDCEMPSGIFSLLFDVGYDIGLALARHPLIKAVGFTGSRRGGLALVEAAQSRPEPIPVFAEMSSINPIFITPGALAERGSAIAPALHNAVTMGVGQFCTNPGVVFIPTGTAGDAFLRELAQLISATEPAVMLSNGIAQAYASGVEKLAGAASVNTHTRVQTGAALFETSATLIRTQPDLLTEIFGPCTLAVRYERPAELPELARSLEGQLTATLHATAAELPAYAQLLAILEERAGRVVLNGFPTGVEVGHAIVHGGPFPATTDGRDTSVGTRAISRFVRPVCFQNFPDSALPEELRSANPLRIRRWDDGVLSQPGAARL